MGMRTFLATLALGTLAATTAQAVDYKFGFTGSGGFELAGVLSFDDALQGTGIIDETQIDDLSIEVFQNGVSIGARSLSGDGLGSTAPFFNVNFDTVAEQFAVGGPSFSETGQNFFSNAGNDCDTVGFSSGSVGQGVCVNGVFEGFVDLASATLTAELVSVTPTPPLVVRPAPVATPVPLPASGLLLLAGIGGLVAMRRKRSA